MKLVNIFFVSIFFLWGLSHAEVSTKPSWFTIHNPYYPTTKPLVRWFWFATKIKEIDVKYQLDWAKKNNFGGVEIAWLFPLYRYQEWYARDFNRHYPIDTSAQKWLSKDWTEIVAYTKNYADSIGLACDFTFGSAWPVAGPNLEKKYGTQIYGDTSFQQLLTFSWSWPEPMRVINHLDSNAFEIFARPFELAMQQVLRGAKSVLFTDSWEIKLNKKNKIWTPGFDTSFINNYGYDILPFMNLGIDSFPDVRYDYMLQLSDYVIQGFYKPFVKKCTSMGAWSRVQCLASPTDVMTAYSLVDIPETEAMLNNPYYSKIVSSAGCLASKKLVSSESFTCIYGFPNTYLRNEQTADLKMVADALFANGVNQHVYCGMPYNSMGSDTIDFFATCYFGPGGSLTKELASFNAYIEKVSGILQKGKTYSDVAVYIPFEDAVMKGAYPPEKQRVWVWGEYEMRYIQTPAEVAGYHPLWINRHFLENAEFKNGKLLVGDAEFSILYMDVKYLDIRALRSVLHMAKKGLKICLKQIPKQPGYVKSSEFDLMLHELVSFQSVSSDFAKIIGHQALIQSNSLPEYWCRVTEDGTKFLFLAQPAAKNLEYPVYSGQSLMKKSKRVDITLNLGNKCKSLKLTFKPYQSIMLKIAPDGNIEFINISFTPNTPVVRPREAQKMYF